MSIQVTINDGQIEGYLPLYKFANRIKVRACTVHEWIKEGKVNDYIKVGDQYWISENELQNFRRRGLIEALLATKGFSEDIGQLCGALCHVAAVRRIAKKYGSMSEVERLKYDVKLLEKENEILNRQSLKP